MRPPQNDVEKMLAEAEMTEAYKNIKTQLSQEHMILLFKSQAHIASKMFKSLKSEGMNTFEAALTVGGFLYTVFNASDKEE